MASTAAATAATTTTTAAPPPPTAATTTATAATATIERILEFWSFMPSSGVVDVPGHRCCRDFIGDRGKKRKKMEK